jgi:O-antigen biosynthesis protein
MNLRRIATRASELWKEGGLNSLRQGWSNYLRQRDEDEAYQRWIEKHESQESLATPGYGPLISVLVPVYNVEEKWLRRCIDSVIEQVYPNWELCIADDASTKPWIRPVLEEYAARDSRIKVVFRNENGHISAASNSALELVSGDLVALLDHDDELSRDALLWVANEINRHSEASLIYSDEDLIDENGIRSNPKFKPDFSRDRFFSSNLLTHLSVFRTDLVRAVGGFRIGFEGSQDYDLSLRVIEKIEEDQIRHIPRVLYHWRTIEGSVAYSMDEKPYAHERARKAIREHLERTGREADVLESVNHLHRVRYKLPDPAPQVSVIVSGRAKDLHVGSEYEILTAGRSATELNDAAERAAGSILIFIDGDLKPPADIDELIATALQPDIGAVGAKIVDVNNVVEENGLVLRNDLHPVSAHRGLPRTAGGDNGRNLLTGNFSAVSLSCMAISREAFESVGGFNADVATDLIDVDLCLRLREQKKRIVVLPHVEFVREGSPRTRALSAEDLRKFQERWPAYLERDPFCNPNLKRDGTFEIDV